MFLGVHLEVMNLVDGLLLLHSFAQVGRVEIWRMVVRAEIVETDLAKMRRDISSETVEYANMGKNVSPWVKMHFASTALLSFVTAQLPAGRHSRFHMLHTWRKRETMHLSFCSVIFLLGKTSMLGADAICKAGLQCGRWVSYWESQCPWRRKGEEVNIRLHE